MGHTVDQRPVEIGEALDDYDKVIVFLAGPRQLVATQVYEGLWAIKAAGDKLVLAFDDWQTKGIFDGIAACKDEEKLFATFILGVNKKELDDLKPFTKDFLAAVDIVSRRDKPVLLSVFAGGDLSLLVPDYPAELLHGYNPNPYHHNRKPGDRADIPASELDFLEAQASPEYDEDFVASRYKLNKFNFASLVQSQTKKWLKKQGVINWEVEFFGNKKEGQRRLKEGEMVQVYAEQWASLMPGYPHAGSGWWRARPLQVADAGSILIGEPKEMMLYYQDEKVANITAQDVEEATPKMREAIAGAQRTLLYKYHPLDKQVQQQELTKALNL